jgi:hypothetical protein
MQRRELLARCMRGALEQLPLVPLYAPDDVYGVRTTVDWEPRLDGRFHAAEAHRAAPRTN